MRSLAARRNVTEKLEAKERIRLPAGVRTLPERTSSASSCTSVHMRLPSFCSLSFSGLFAFLSSVRACRTEDCQILRDADSAGS